MKPNTIIIDPKDNVAIALQDISKGAQVVLPDGRKFPSLTDIPYSHKVLLADLSVGDSIIKYGELIGQATENIQQGDWIHTHNLTAEEV
jgi:hypothetical protein